MNNTTLRVPFYIKASVVLIGLYVLTNILDRASGILIPLIFASLLAIALLPLVNKLEKLRIGRVLSIILPIILIFVIVALISGLIVPEANLLSKSLPNLINEFQQLMQDGAQWVSLNFKISAYKVNGWITGFTGDVMSQSSGLIGSIIKTTGNAVITISLIVLYLFLLLYYRSMIRQFIQKVFVNYETEKIDEIWRGIKTTVQHYLTGLLIELAFVFVMYFLGLLIIGNNYALLLALVCAMLNIIPYIGAIISLVLLVVITITNSPSFSSVIYVILLYSIIHLTDNTFIIPRIVASQVKINALVAIIAIVSGTALWGIPGTILSVPLTALIKLVFDQIDQLKPWGFLIGTFRDLKPGKKKL